LKDHKWLPKSISSKSNSLSNEVMLPLNQKQLAKKKLRKERAKEKL
jgi:hypothetical protein